MLILFTCELGLTALAATARVSHNMLAPPPCILSCATSQLQSQGRRYSLRDCGIVCLIVVGLATFMNAETRSSAESETPTSLLGVACISLALVIDAANINIQVR